MVKETALYDTLGVSPDASDAQLKTAYKKGALKHHPDKNAHNPEAETKFKEISSAYEVLADPQKRQMYDQYGSQGLEQGGGAGGMNAEDIFAQFFGGGGMGGGMGGGGFSPFGSMFGGGGGRDAGPKKAKTIRHSHKVTLEDIYRGKVSKLALQKSIICPGCDGRGGKEGAVKKCNSCDGQGVKMMMRQMGPMIQRFQSVCPECNGEGEMIREKDRCKSCKGKKTTVERKILHVHVDRGVQNGARIDFPGEGDQLPGVEPGDVVFDIEQKPHTRFERKNDDLFYHAEIDLLTALAGGEILIEHLDDRWLSVKIIPGEVISPGSIKVIREQGMPSYRHHDFGNLYIKFDVKFPHSLQGPDGGPMTDQQRTMLEQVLPPRKPQASQPSSDAMIEDFDLDDIDSSRENARATQGASAMDEDEDDVQGERVQCASTTATTAARTSLILSSTFRRPLLSSFLLRPTATLAPIAFGTIYTYSYARDYSTELFHGDAATRGTSGIQRSSSRLYSTFASSFSSPASGLNRSASSATTQDSANPNANSSSTGGSPATGGRSMHTSLAIIGSGPAAHTAAIYAARADLKPVLYEGFLALGIAAGGQLTTTDEVENYPGFGNIKGQELMDQMRAQSEASGATIVTQTVSRLDLSKRPFTFYLHPLGDDTTEDPDPHTADSIILATGAAARRLYLPGEDKYWGNGVSACAVCDGSLPIFRQKPLVVVGGGDSAVEEATYLAKKAASVTVLVRKDQMRASKVNARRLANNDKVKIRYNTAPTRIAGEQDPDTAANGSVKPNGLMTALHVRNTKTGAEERIDANGLFYAVGHEPATSLVKGQLETDEDGYVITDPGTMKTKIPGVFAAGDVQDKKYRQAVTSAGSGCVAALEAEKFLAEMEDVVQARDGGVLESGLERESEVKKPNGGQNGEGGKNAPEYRSNPLL